MAKDILCVKHFDPKSCNKECLEEMKKLAIECFDRDPPDYKDFPPLIKKEKPIENRFFFTRIKNKGVMYPFEKITIFMHALTLIATNGKKLKINKLTKKKKYNINIDGPTFAETVNLRNQYLREMEEQDDHLDCFWCKYFAYFDCFLFEPALSACDLIELSIKEIAEHYYLNVPLIVTLAKYHLNDVSCEIIAEIDKHVPEKIKKYYGKVSSEFYHESEGWMNYILHRDILNLNETTEEEYNQAIGKFKMVKSARK